MVASDNQALVLYGKEIFHAHNVFDDKLLVLKKARDEFCSDDVGDPSLELA